MGIEYRLQFKGAGDEALLFELGRLQGAQRSGAHVEFRSTARQAEPWADAVTWLDEDGLYFCDNGADGRAFLGQVVARLVSRYGATTVEER